MSATLSTTIGELPLEEVELAIGDRTFSILHTGALISAQEEVDFLRGENQTKRPYGIALWPAAIALAHSLAERELRGKRILELGAGTGLPGIVAASLGAQVVQTDRQKVVLHVCQLNAERNAVKLEQRLADWTEWDETRTFDLIVGSDILYAAGLHDHLRHIVATNLAPGGSVVIADPAREASIPFFEQRQAEGFRVAFDKWTISERPIGVYTITK